MYREEKKITLPKTIEAELAYLASQFFLCGKELNLVGGCIRDILLNKEPHDYDLCTDATPEEVKSIIQVFLTPSQTEHPYKFHIIETGIKHGTVTLYQPESKNSYEITTYRVDGKYSDNRHPDEVNFTPSLEEDLKRRDFTINSFAYDLFKGKLIMLEESFLKDLEYGIIKTVGDPAERYEEDALRMLRALRFSAQLNFSIEKYTYYAIKMCAPLLRKISKERIRDELTKILLSDHPEVLDLFVVSNLEKYAFDNLTPLTDMLNCEHENPWHYTDVFHHTLDVVKKVSKTFELRWSALLHDCGKPASKKPRPQGPEGHYVYYDHPEKSAEIALQLMEMLKFSNDQIDIIYKYVKYHDYELVTCKNSIFKRILVDIGMDNFSDFIKLRFADSIAHKLLNDTKYAIDYIDALYARFDKVKEQEEALTVKDLALNGYNMMDLGFQGKEIGIKLNYLLEKVLENPELNKREELIKILKNEIE